MVDIAKYTKIAKDEIQNLFGIEIEVDFVKTESMAQRKAELAKIYNKELDGSNIGDGLFLPAEGESKPVMLVGYDDDSPEFISIFYHELQHVIDYYRAQESLGKETLEEFMPYFYYYTEFNAGFQGTFYYTVSILDILPTQIEKQKFLQEGKDHFRNVVKNRHTFFDILLYLSKVSAFAEIEKKIDYSMLAGLPEQKFFSDLVNFMNRYEPTREWYSYIGEYPAQNERFGIHGIFEGKE